jgi:hypothetical protein
MRTDGHAPWGSRACPPPGSVPVRIREYKIDIAQLKRSAEARDCATQRATLLHSRMFHNPSRPRLRQAPRPCPSSLIDRRSSRAQSTLFAIAANLRRRRTSSPPFATAEPPRQCCRHRPRSRLHASPATTQRASAVPQTAPHLDRASGLLDTQRATLPAWQRR